MIRQDADVPTGDGLMNTIFYAPDKGKAPAILFYMDAAGIRPELHEMAQRIAAAGLLVALPNLFYRTDRDVDFSAAAMECAGPSLMKVMLEKSWSLTYEMLSRDTDALMKFVDTLPGADGGPMGAIGYCMSGRWAMHAAAQHPDRLAAVASFYGTRLVTDQPDSAHLWVDRIKAELYVGAAENDHLVPLEHVQTLRDALSSTDVKHRIEVYPGTQHGFAFKRAHYAPEAAARHWDVLLDLFARNLRSAPSPM